MNILDQLADYARERVARDKAQVSLETLKAKALALPDGGLSPLSGRCPSPSCPSSASARRRPPPKGSSRRSSPIWTSLAPTNLPGRTPSRCSPNRSGSWAVTSICSDIAAAVDIPCLRKDFTVDEYMIYQAKVLGASAVLLICSLLKEGEIRDSIALCDTLGLSALVEAHDEDEVKTALNAGARVIGVNNRNLKDLLGGHREQQAPAGADPAGCIVRVRERRGQRPGRGGIAWGGGGRGTHRRDPDAGGGQARQAGRTARCVMTKIKLCGLSRLEDIQAANRLRPDYVGFVFASKSCRYVTPTQAKTLKEVLDEGIQAVGVFVDAPVEQVASLLNRGVIDVAQLHGHEEDGYIQILRQQTERPIWQAFRVARVGDLAAAQTSAADCILLDSGAGTGKVFDWDLLQYIHRPYFLAGGLDAGQRHRRPPAGAPVWGGRQLGHRDGRTKRPRENGAVCGRGEKRKKTL